MASCVPNSEATRFKAGKEQVEIAKKGARASIKARREKKTMKETLLLMLDMPDKDGVTFREKVTAGLIKGATKGDARNYKVIVETLGELFVAQQDRQAEQIAKVTELLSKLDEEAKK